MPDGYTVPADYEVHIEIISKTGCDLEKIGIPEEKEVAFGTNTQFAIIGFEVDGNTAYLKLEELENYGTEENN